ncbi:hypothetical protein [Niabella sp.]|uniref:hypothetical protein n=1 Tax=Niabella sp. TaxID=1962976 RepID=UPI00261BD76B|nr:hypothetical protein [Niabella sp.]
MRQIVSILLCLFLCVNSYSQKNRLQLGIGYQRTWIVDQQASPLKYQTSEKTFLLGYEHTGNGGKLSARIEGGLGKLAAADFPGRWLNDPGYNNDGTPKKDSFPISGKLYNARVQLGYLKALSHGYSKLGNGGVHTADYWGGSVSNQLFYTDNMIRTGWLNTASLNTDYEHTIRFNTRHNISIKVSIPLFARNSRLPYHNSISSATGDSNIKTFFKQGSRFAWLGNFQNVRVDAQYEYAVGKRMGFGLHYSGQWLHYSHERPITLFQNNIGVIASIK